MKETTNNVKILPIITIVLLCIVSVMGVFSIDFTKSYEITNHYGDIVKMYGNGIYANDSYFKAAIFLGTDLCVIFIIVPIFIYTYFKDAKKNSNITRLMLMSLYAITFYYAASLAFGATYNQLHLIYIALFTCSLFGIFQILRTINIDVLNVTVTKGMKIYLVIGGISLFVAWMPDVIPTLINSSMLPLIETYTTEITYIIDMGIIGPLFWVCLYLINKKDNLGIVILVVLLNTSAIFGVLLAIMCTCQIFSGYHYTILVFSLKSGSFIALSGFSIYFVKKILYQLNKVEISKN